MPTWWVGFNFPLFPHASAFRGKAWDCFTPLFSYAKAWSSPLEIAIRKFENHPSVQVIKQNISVNKDFYFSNIEVSDILKETTHLNNKKNGTFGNTPTKLLKAVSDICAPALNDIWNNEIITQKCFPKNLKLVDVTPGLKKEDASLLKNLDHSKCSTGCI